MFHIISLKRLWLAKDVISLFIRGVCIQLGVSLGVVCDSSKGLLMQSCSGGLLAAGIFHTSVCQMKFIMIQ